MNSKKALISLMLITTLVAQNKGARPKDQSPKPIVPFQLSYEEVPMIKKLDLRGSVLVQFTIDEYGKVVKPKIVDSFTSIIDDVVIDKVMTLRFEPVIQNGVPIRVRYSLPILFK